MLSSAWLALRSTNYACMLFQAVWWGFMEKMRHFVITGFKSSGSWLDTLTNKQWATNETLKKGSFLTFHSYRFTSGKVYSVHHLVRIHLHKNKTRQVRPLSFINRRHSNLTTMLSYLHFIVHVYVFWIQFIPLNLLLCIVLYCYMLLKSPRMHASKYYIVPNSKHFWILRILEYFILGGRVDWSIGSGCAEP